MDLKDEIIKLLREELEYVEGNHKEGTHYSQWIIAVRRKLNRKQSR